MSVAKIQDVDFIDLDKAQGVDFANLEYMNTKLLHATSSVLKGFSGSIDAYSGDTPTSIAGADDLITKLEDYGGNVYRISFNPSWTSGSRPWGTQNGVTGPDKVDYLLDNWDGYIIVDRNHHLSPYDTVPLGGDGHWAPSGVLAGCLEVGALWPDNPRIIIEIVNEFVTTGAPNYYTIWEECPAVIAGIEAAGYTNSILVNKHSSGNDWTVLANLDYYGKHFYANNYTLASMQGYMNDANAAGCTPICNTEMGAEADEPPFSDANVTELESYQTWLSAQGYGYCIWLNHNIYNLTTYNGYEDRGWLGLI